MLRLGRSVTRGSGDGGKGVWPVLLTPATETLRSVAELLRVPPQPEGAGSVGDL